MDGAERSPIHHGPPMHRSDLPSSDPLRGQQPEAEKPLENAALRSFSQRLEEHDNPPVGQNHHVSHEQVEETPLREQAPQPTPGEQAPSRAHERPSTNWGKFIRWIGTPVRAMINKLSRNRNQHRNTAPAPPPASALAPPLVNTTTPASANLRNSLDGTQQLGTATTDAPKTDTPKFDPTVEDMEIADIVIAPPTSDAPAEEPVETKQSETPKYEPETLKPDNDFQIPEIVITPPPPTYAEIRPLLVDLRNKQTTLMKFADNIKANENFSLQNLLHIKMTEFKQELAEDNKKVVELYHDQTNELKELWTKMHARTDSMMEELKQLQNLNNNINTYEKLKLDSINYYNLLINTNPNALNQKNKEFKRKIYQAIHDKNSLISFNQFTQDIRDIKLTSHGNWDLNRFNQDLNTLNTKLNNLLLYGYTEKDVLPKEKIQMKKHQPSKDKPVQGILKNQENVGKPKKKVQFEETAKEPSEAPGMYPRELKEKNR